MDESVDMWAEIRRAASLVRDYYEALVNEGFTPEQAFELTKAGLSAGSL